MDRASRSRVKQFSVLPAEGGGQGVQGEQTGAEGSALVALAAVAGAAVAAGDSPGGDSVPSWEDKLAGARSIKPGGVAPSLIQWADKKSKPNNAHLQAAMQERLTADEVKRGRPSPKQWSNQKIADWLAERAPLEATEGDQGVAGGQQAQGGAVAAPSEGAAAPIRVPGACRWSMRTQGVRLIETICDDDNREAFLRRHEKPETRGALESGDPNSAWIRFAKSFNDRTKDYSLVSSKSVLANEYYQQKGFTPEWTPYEASGEILKDKFGELSKSLNQYLARFSQSGQGACATDEAVQEALDQNKEKGVDSEASLTVFSCDFWNFCKSEPVVFYFYERANTFDLLMSAARAMPPWSKASSTNAPSASGSGPPPQPACKPSAAGRHGAAKVQVASAIHKLSTSVEQGLSAPVRIDKSDHEQTAEYCQAVRMKLSMKRELMEEYERVAFKLEEADTWLDDFKRVRPPDTTPPSHRLKLAHHLRMQLEKLEAQMEMASPVMKPPQPRAAGGYREGKDEDEDEGEDDEGGDGGEDDEDEDEDE